MQSSNIFGFDETAPNPALKPTPAQVAAPVVVAEQTAQVLEQESKIEPAAQSTRKFFFLYSINDGFTNHAWGRYQSNAINWHGCQNGWF